ncbi:autotransporter adhesin [Alcanivorax xiamenensis]|uniref:Autotransporter adhesin n=1 Tax=Alcanivorax xiamenensis TaxID=1177156 RepID=A0ABQ6Y3I5_9GAMM|nr:autotransporter adhesin [Alcanivorax xiamenensis]
MVASENARGRAKARGERLNMVSAAPASFPKKKFTPVALAVGLATAGGALMFPAQRVIADTEVEAGNNISVSSRAGDQGQVVYSISTQGDVTFDGVTSTVIESDDVTSRLLTVSENAILQALQVKDDADVGGALIVSGPATLRNGLDMDGNQVVGVADGTALNHAVNLGQLEAVEAAAEAAGRGWGISAGGNPGANVAPGDAVDFSGDGNIEVSRTGTDLAFSLGDDIAVDSLNAAGTVVDGGGVQIGSDVRLDSSGLTLSGGPSVTVSGIDGGGLTLSNIANGAIAAGSQEAVTGAQLHELRESLYTAGEGVKYFHANSVADDAVAGGDESIAIGPLAISEGAHSIAAGDGAGTTETAEGAIAMGQGAMAGSEQGAVEDGEGSIAIGRDSLAGGNHTLAIGDGASVESEYTEGSMALGAGARIAGHSDYATAIGFEAEATANNATALGGNAKANGGGSIAIGQAEATGENAFAAGTGAYAGSLSGIALGLGAGVGTNGTAAGDKTSHIAIGTQSGRNVDGNQTIAIGYEAGSDVTGDQNVAIGSHAGAQIQGDYNVAIGHEANREAGVVERATAIGGQTEAGRNAVALGYGASAADNGMALGSNSSADHSSMALGRNAVAEGGSVALGGGSAALSSDATGQGYLTGSDFTGGTVVSVGNTDSGQQRRIVNVADGSQGYDAVNVNQLRAAQQGVANLVGGDVTLDADGSYSGYVVELQDSGGNSHQYGTVAEAINAVSSGAINVLPGNAVTYNPNNTITVSEGVVEGDAVNLGQMNAAIAENGVKYFSVNSNDPANRDNSMASGSDALAIGPGSTAAGRSSLATGHLANTVGDQSVALGYEVEALGDDATVVGSGSDAYGDGSVAIGLRAKSQGNNSIVMGTDAQADPKSTDATVDDAIVIGTRAEATADNGIAMGESALASEMRAVAQGYDAHATANDAQASGTRARASGVSSQASGTDARASGSNAIATGTEAHGLAANSVAIGSNAVAGFAPLPGEEGRNVNAVAIGNSAQAVEQDALAVGRGALAEAQDAAAFGRQAQATAESALAAGTGARATGEGASAFGRNAQAMHTGSVALGSDAITAAAVGTSSATVDKQTYDFAGTAPIATVSVGDVGQERTVTNVAAGRISATSTDAINGSQLHGTNQAVNALADNVDTAGQSVAGALGGNASYDPNTHQVTTSNVGGTGEDSVDDAIRYAAQGWNISANGQTGENVAPGGAVDFSNSDGNIEIARAGTDLTFNLSPDIEIDNSITVGDTTINNDGLTIDGGPSVTSGGIDAGDLVITNVAPGEVGAASTDAINGGQLFGVADSVSSVVGGNAVVNPDGSITTSDIGNTGE